MKMITVAVVAMIAAMAAGGFAWQKAQALAETKAELASANATLQRAKSDMLAMAADITTLRKEVAEQKMASDQLRAELATAQSFLDAEKAIGARLREELVKAREQLASINRLRPVQAAPVGQPMVINPRPMVIRAAPGGTAIGAGAPAR